MSTIYDPIHDLCAAFVPLVPALLLTVVLFILVRVGPERRITRRLSIFLVGLIACGFLVESLESFSGIYRAQRWLRRGDVAIVEGPIDVTPVVWANELNGYAVVSIDAEHFDVRSLFPGRGCFHDPAGLRSGESIRLTFHDRCIVRIDRLPAAHDFGSNAPLP